MDKLGLLLESKEELGMLLFSRAKLSLVVRLGSFQGLSKLLKRDTRFQNIKMSEKNAVAVALQKRRNLFSQAG